MLEEIFQRPASATFLQVREKNYSYDWLRAKIKNITGLSDSLGLKRQDKVLLSISAEGEFAAIFLSALTNGLTTVMLDPGTKRGRALGIIERVSPALIIADQASLDDWRIPTGHPAKILSFRKETRSPAGILGKFLKKNQAPVQENDYTDALQKAASPDHVPALTDTDAIAYIIFTSGTTAASKGVAISYGNLNTHLATLKKVYSLGHDSVLLNQLLLWHADGCIQGPVLAAYTGCAWHSPFSFSIDKIPPLLDYGYANEVTHFFVVPAMLNLLSSFAAGYEDSFRYPAFRALISVSAHLDSPLWDKVESTFGVRVSNIYGLTETVAGSLFCGPMENTYRKYTAGKPVDTAIRIVDENMQDVETGQTGELLLSGPHIMKAYYDDPAATANGFHDGWLMTGDYAAADEDGFVTIKGRKKNLIISGGYNIQPEEVTEALLKNEAVLEACALGVHDEVFGEKLIAAVVPGPGHSLTSAEIIDQCRTWLEEKKVPQKIFIVDAFPKGPSGKVQLNELRSQLAKSSPGRNDVSGNILDEVLAAASESFQVPVSGLSSADTSQTIGGWDSLAHLTFVTLLEERFDIHFSTAEVMTLNSIAKAAQLIKERHA